LAKKNNIEFPRAVVVMLVVAAVCISVFATWVVMNHIDKIRATPTTANQVAVGKVSVTVIDGPSDGQTDIQEGEENGGNI